jgi:flagellar biosynthesis/type III secretory pathway chaperone
MIETSQDVARLLELLEAEETLYGELRAALQSEQVCLVNLEAEGLDEAVRQKETLVTEARVLEEGRRALVRRLGGGLGTRSATPTLTELCNALGSDAAALRDAHSRLSSRVAAVRELLEVNTAFSGEAMGQVRATLQLLGRLAPLEATYRADGAEATSSGRLVRQSA